MPQVEKIDVTTVPIAGSDPKIENKEPKQHPSGATRDCCKADEQLAWHV